MDDFVARVIVAAGLVRHAATDPQTTMRSDRKPGVVPAMTDELVESLQALIDLWADTAQVPRRETVEQATDWLLGKHSVVRGGIQCDVCGRVGRALLLHECRPGGIFERRN